jgi:hypothetical protein
MDLSIDTSMAPGKVESDWQERLSVVFVHDPNTATPRNRIQYFADLVVIAGGCSFILHVES